MKHLKTGSELIDEYILRFPDDIQQRLNELRSVIRAAVPEAEEKISYGMPAYALAGNLVYFAAYDKHIGFYPTQRGIEKFKDELKVYKLGKGSIQFPFSQPMPYDLISRIVKARVKENLLKAMASRRNKIVFSGDQNAKAKSNPL